MKYIKIFLFFIFFISGNALGADNKQTNSGDINFSSEKLKVDEKTKIMIASGNVIITNNNRQLTADKVEYDQNSDKAIATGNVKLKEKDGSIYESERVILTNEFKSVVAIPLYGELIDKSFIKSNNFKKNDLGESYFKEGVYTACECDFKQDVKPIWRVETKEIKHDPATKTIYLKHPVMRIFSIPVYYLPYLSFPDWTVKRRSGFLTPVYGYSKQNRFHIKVPYYYSPENDPTWDMTFTSHQNGKTGHADQLNIRKKYENSSLETNIYKGNLDTNKSDGDNVFGVNFKANSNLDNNWKMTIEGKYADQETFMRRYGFDSSDRYKSYLNLEKIKPNSISKIEIYNIQNLDETSSNNEPVLAPSISHHIFDSNKSYNYDVKLNAHSIYNDESYDIKRWSGLAQINKKLNLTNIVLEGDANFGLDLYSIQGRPSTDSNDNKYIDRLSSGFSVAASNQYGIMSEEIGVVIEPKIQFSSVISSDRTDEVPNRDSSEFRLDQANLFLNNQYQGRDNIQRSDRINAGVSAYVMTEEMGDLNFFIGQSQKISGTQKNISSANNDRQSHLINSISWNPSSLYNFSWFSLYNHHNLKSDTSDFNFNGSLDGWNYSTRHRSVDGAFVSDGIDREELALGISKNFSNWKTSYSRTYDLSNDKEEMISETLGLEYTGSGYMFGNCLTVLFQYKSSGGVVDRDLVPEDSIYLTFNFRNLGAYQWQPKEINKSLNKNLRY
ncbi:LPS assembly protein LptD [Alphaproteobacteria bacterium]|jgi:LPS-assembly protein|nr:LPS assembly protein LptD [Alphaproteobacteria bacterium]